MYSPPPENQPSIVIDTDRIGRWNVYQRLQQLAIPCTCTSMQPLKVEVRTASDAILLWSVIQRCIGSRQDSLERLERCWQQPAHH